MKSEKEPLFDVPISRWKMCDRKIASTKKGAKRRLKNKPDFRAYECPYCGFWHLTKK